MVSVNQTRSGMAQDVKDAVGSARLIGFDARGMACVWSGGYTFNVYDAASGWNETRSFTSGHLAGMTDRERRTKQGINAAIERMKSEGFEVVTPE